MRTFRFDKLVRDKILPQMQAEGSVVVWRKLTDTEYNEELMRKLVEELDELKDGVGKDRERDLNELADVAEVYETAWDIVDKDEYYDIFDTAMTELERGIDMWEFDPAELLAAKVAKVARMGAFKDRIYIETVSVDDDNKWLKTYLATPKKYPEIK